MSIQVKYDFKGSVALVTGAASGMGLTTAKAFAEAGASVTLADNNEALLQEVTQKLLDAGLKVLATKCDVTNDAEIEAMVNKTVETFGRLDIAFNNAGINNRSADIDVYPNEVWERVIDINLRGVWSCMKYELKQMLSQGSGSIINCSSIGGVVGVAGSSAYIAAKHGVIGLTSTAALEYARRGIRINAVLPGMIETPMAQWLTNGDQKVLDAMKQEPPMARFGTAEEIANAVLWLGSNASSYVTGHSLLVDGGITARL